MRTGLVGLVALALVALLSVASTAGDLPFLIHGGVGFGKWIEDGAPDGSIGFGAGIIYPLEGLPIGVGADLGYVMLGSVSESSDIYGVSVEAKFSVIPVTGQAYYMIPASDAATFYGVGGLGLYNMRVSVDVEAGGVSSSESDSETKFGINLGAGAKLGNPDSKINFGFDVKYHIVLTDVENTNLLTAFGRVYFQ